MKESVTILKLTNGESIIGRILNAEEFFSDNQKTIHISLPLKFVLMPKLTDAGVAESLSLSPWVHPLTDSETVNVNSRNIVMTCSASPDLATYYEHCVKSFNFFGGAQYGTTEVATPEPKQDASTNGLDPELDPTDEELIELMKEELLNIKTKDILH